MKRNRENFFIWRYFMYFCSVAVIPVALTMFIYLDTVRIVKEEEYQSIVNAVEQNSKMIDEYIIGMRHLAINLRSNQQANDFFADGDPMRDPNCITDIINVQKYIASLLRLNSTFDDIFLYSEKSGALVTQSSAYTRLAEGYSPIHFGLEDTGSAGIDFLTTQYRDEFLYDACIGRKDTYGNYLVYADTVELAGYHRTIFVLLNNSRISQLFKQILDNSEGFLYITGRDGNVVLGEGLPDDTVLARVREKAAGEGGYFIQSVGGKKMFISYVKEAQNTFEYYFAMDLIQDLAGEDANIIFGAKYDETMTDEATITVIATGLENPSMKMKPQQQAGGIGGRMVYPNTNNVRPTGSVGIVSRAAASGNNSFPGVNNSNYVNTGTGVGSRPVNQPQPQAPTPSASNYSGIQRPKPVESNVKPVEINIPDFLKNPRR